MNTLFHTVFGAKAQVVIGAVCSVVGALFWAYIEWRYPSELKDGPLTAAIFRVSMFFGLTACYAIIATGLGYRATERVEEVVIGEAEGVDIEHADDVEVGR